MKRSRLPFDHHPQEQRGVLFLLLTILVIQMAYWAWLHFLPVKEVNIRTEPFAADSIPVWTYEPKPFNPNFISDYKGYLLGLSPGEIDKLHEFRASGNWIRTVEEFREVTGVSDSLLKNIAPFFQFPVLYSKREDRETRVFSRGDLNRVSPEELRAVHGVGPVLSERIVRFRDALGGFVQDSQLYDVYGLEKEIVAEVLRRFRVIEPAIPEKVSVNDATREELSAVVYINWKLADAIVRHRERYGPYKNVADLRPVEGFPQDKIHRIGLYLEF